MQNLNPYGGYNNFSPYNMQPQMPIQPQMPMQPQMSAQEVTQEQPQSPTIGTPIQTIQNNQSLNPQAVCYFVAAKDEMQGLKVEPNTFYIGINKQAKEMYVRSWNNDGNIDFNTYTLTEGKKESSGISAIIEKLEGIENKLTHLSNQASGQVSGQVSGQASGQVSDQVNTQPILSVKEETNEQYATESNSKRNGWSLTKRSTDGTF